MDDSPWTPAVFPAAVLDNLPNFQLGAKDSVRYFVKRMARFYGDKNLKEAGELLDYPADIWLFSQTGEDRLAPGSAKQYRKAPLAIADDVAAALFISPNYLRQLFKQETGQTFTEFLTAQRMQHAHILLGNPQTKVCDVAEQAGYADSRYFSVCFKKFYHMTPSEYQAAALEGKA